MITLLLVVLLSIIAMTKITEILEVIVSAVEMKPAHTLPIIMLHHRKAS